MPRGDLQSLETDLQQTSPALFALINGPCAQTPSLAYSEHGQQDPDRNNPELSFVSDELNGLSIDHFVNRPRPYLPRRFSSISKIIEDINRSRLYLGVHWNFDCVRGPRAGPAWQKSSMTEIAALASPEAAATAARLSIDRGHGLGDAEFTPRACPGRLLHCDQSCDG